MVAWNIWNPNEFELEMPVTCCKKTLHRAVLRAPVLMYVRVTSLKKSRELKKLLSIIWWRPQASSDYFCPAGQDGNLQKIREEDHLGAMGWAGLHGHSVWDSGPAHLVGILLGHYGASHLLHHIRQCHGNVCVLCSNPPGETWFWLYSLFLKIAL